MVAFADDPDDDDDLRLRKRVGVTAGILTIFAPLSLPIQAQGHPLSIVLAAVLPLFSAANLAVLARTGRFDRYVLALILVGTIWSPLAHIVGGGITGTTAGLGWAFLVPAYAIPSLGPRRAIPWFVIFVVSVLGMAVADPRARATFGEGSYPLRVIGWTTGVILPLAIVFVLLRYTDMRRRIAEARVDEPLVNAIPASIATRLKHGEATRSGSDYAGRGVNLASRVGDAASGDEILMTRRSLDRSRRTFHLGEDRSLELKGMADRVDVVTVRWR